MMGIILMLVIIVNFIIGIFNNNKSFSTIFFSYNGYPLFIFTLLSFLTTTKENKFSQAFQILIFFAAGIIAILVNDSGSLTQVNLIVFAIILCLQYDFLKNYFFLKISVIFLIYAVFQLFLEYIKNPGTYLSSIQPIIYALFYFYMIWIAFEEEIKDYIQKTKKMKLTMDKNEVFVLFGKNISGVIHTLKNKLMAIQSFNDLISDSKEPEIQQYSLQQKSIINRTIQLIASLNYAVKARQDNEAKIISLGKIISSVVDLFESNSKFHTDVVIKKKLVENDFIKISPLNASQLLENLIRNSWEAMGDRTVLHLEIETENTGQKIKLMIRDDGVGIPFCENCQKQNCLNCKEFAIGKTTKKEGSGIGMIYAMDIIQKAGAGLKLKSTVHSGTTIEITFPIVENNRNYLID